jgi:hypothetical protein
MKHESLLFPADKRKTFKPCLVHALKVMCEFAGVKYCNVNFDNPNWYHQAEWTQAREDEYLEWLMNYCLENKDARYEILGISRKYPVKTIKTNVKAFVWNFGWKVSSG